MLGVRIDVRVRFTLVAVFDMQFSHDAPHEKFTFVHREYAYAASTTSTRTVMYSISNIPGDAVGFFWVWPHSKWERSHSNRFWVWSLAIWVWPHSKNRLKWSKWVVKLMDKEWFFPIMTALGETSTNLVQRGRERGWIRNGLREISNGFPLRVNRNLPNFADLRDTISLRDFH
jgi:hypothetical protein